MAKITFELNTADREELADRLIRLIAKTPRIVGTEVNWIQLSVDSILDAFQEAGVDSISGIGSSKISKIIEDLTTPVSRGYAFGIAELILVELAQFTARKEQVAPEVAVIPTDETHDFGVLAKILAGSSNPQPFPVPTEEEALRALANYKKVVGRQDLVIVARPKVQPWTVLSYED